MTPIIGTVLLAGLSPIGEPKYINGTYLVAALDSDGQPHILEVDSSGALVTSGGSSGGAPTGAQYVVGAAHADLSAELVLGTAVIMAGTLAARPAASLAGLLYFATDNKRLYRDTGAAWVDISQRPYKFTQIYGQGNITTSGTSFAVVDNTKFPPLALTLEVNDVVRLDFSAGCYNSAQNLIMFDVNVNRPVSADVFVSGGADDGIAQANDGSGARGQPNTWFAFFTATEAGIHTFQLYWRVNTGTGTLSNATSGADEIGAVFSVENKGPVATL